MIKNLFTPQAQAEDGRRVGVLLPDGMIELKNFALAKSGFYPVPTGSHYESGRKPRITPAQARAQNVPVLDLSTYESAKTELTEATNGNIPSVLAKQNYSKSLNTNSKMNADSNSAFKVTKQGNQSAIYRAEKGANIKAERTFEITVDASNVASTQAQSVVLGDFAGIHRAVNVIAALQAIPLDGTFGANSISIFRNITGTNPMKIKGFLFSDTTNNFFLTGKIKAVRYNIDGSVKSQANIPLSRLKRPDQFDSKIQLLELTQILDGLSVVEVIVPDNSVFSMSIYCDEVADVYGFSEVNE
jgi:hypothetical protein